jgi:hypothetical protein
VTAANVTDIAAAKAMPIEAGATYAFDLGYYDFAFWARLDALGCRLVTRFKANTPLNSPRDMPLSPGSTPLSDRIGFLPARQAMNRKNPMQDGAREIVVRTETGQTLRLLADDLDAPAQEIAVALIAYLLLRALQQIAKEDYGFLELVRLVRANLMHRKDPTRLRSPQPPPLFDPRQLQLTLAPT